MKPAHDGIFQTNRSTTPPGRQRSLTMLIRMTLFQEATDYVHNRRCHSNKSGLELPLSSSASLCWFFSLPISPTCLARPIIKPRAITSFQSWLLITTRPIAAFICYCIFWCQPWKLLPRSVRRREHGGVGSRGPEVLKSPKVGQLPVTDMKAHLQRWLSSRLTVPYDPTHSHPLRSATPPSTLMPTSLLTQYVNRRTGAPYTCTPVPRHNCPRP